MPEPYVGFVGQLQYHSSLAQLDAVADLGDRLNHPHPGEEHSVGRAEIAHEDPVAPNREVEVMGGHRVVGQDQVAIGITADLKRSIEGNHPPFFGPHLDRQLHSPNTNGRCARQSSRLFVHRRPNLARPTRLSFVTVCRPCDLSF